MCRGCRARGSWAFLTGWTVGLFNFLHVGQRLQVEVVSGLLQLTEHALDVTARQFELQLGICEFEDPVLNDGSLSLRQRRDSRLGGWGLWRLRDETDRAHHRHDDRES